jgi:replicative DNA helicase
VPDEAVRLPQDSAAERAVLAAVLVDRSQLDGVREILKTKDFLDARHQRIFEVYCELDDGPQVRKIDLLTVRAELERTGTLDAAGGAGYLSELLDGVARSSNAADYAKLVRERSLSRELHRFGSRIASDAIRNSPQEILAAAEQDLFAIAEGSFASGPVRLTEDLSWLAEESTRQREGFSGIRTGFQDLDNLMGGLRKSDLILVGARPGEGKTSLALNIALAAGRADKRVLIFSLEMPRRQIATRLLFSQAEVDARQLSRPGLLSERDRRLIQNTLPVVASMPIFVDDSNVTPVELRSKARQLSREHGLDLIVIDYLQLMRGAEPGSRRFENRNLEIAEISRSFKLMAKELDVPILALSQLSRAPEQRTGALTAPRLSDLRESGALEQDADIVIFIHRPRPKEGPGSDSGGPPKASEERRIIVAKNRNGPVGSVRLAWQDRYTRFATLGDEQAGRDADYPDPDEETGW